MGNLASKISRQSSRSVSDSACCCRTRGTMVVSEERRRRPKQQAVEEMEDLDFLLAYRQIKPRTCCSKIAFGFRYFFCEICAICCPPCPGRIINKLAFRPPNPPTYELRLTSGNEYRIHLLSVAVKYIRIRYRRCQSYVPHLRCFYVQKTGPRIACIYAQAFTPVVEEKPLTLLYSHNNGMDLGLIAGYISLLARRLRVNVFTYDYSGYGLSYGQCSEERLYENAETAYLFLTQELAISPKRIVIVGTSLGSAAAIHLASTYRSVKGVILQGAFLSALRVVCPRRKRTCQIDQFVNIDKINRIKRPTLVIHGKDDSWFKVIHAEKLRRLCPGAKKVEPLIIDDCDHIEFDEHSRYWQRMHRFLHAELTSIGIDRPCCTNHQTEVDLRHRLRHERHARRQRNKRMKSDRARNVVADLSSPGAPLMGFGDRCLQESGDPV